MRKLFRRAVFLCAVLSVLSLSGAGTAFASSVGSPQAGAVLSDTPSPLTLCLAYYDSRGQFISLEATENVMLNPETGDAVLPIRETPARAAVIKVFLFDGEFHILAPVTVGSYSTIGQ